MSSLAVIILRQQRQKEDLDAALRYVPNTHASFDGRKPLKDFIQLFSC